MNKDKPSKIMVFDEKIKHYNETIINIKPEKGICSYCNKESNLNYEIYNYAFPEPYKICNKCAMIYYGGITPANNGTKIPIDPLLLYLDEMIENERMIEYEKNHRYID